MLLAENFEPSYSIVIEIKLTHVTDVEAVDDVTCEVPNLLKIVASNGTAFVKHKHHVNAEALEAALFQLVACFNEVGHVTSGTVVRRPEDGLSLDVARDAVVVIARLKQHVLAHVETGS